MPFIQPTGVSTRQLSNKSVSSLAKSTNGASSDSAVTKKLEPEKSCRVTDNWVKSADDSIHIFTKTWHPVGISVQSVLVFIHDALEHCERYQPLFTYFPAKGIKVHSFDLPGFGETGARADAHGVTGGYDALLKEIDKAIDRATNAHPTKPLILMGHGMGGALVLNYVCGLGQRITSLAGVISSSPYLKPTMKGAGSRFPSTYNRLSKWYPNVRVNFRVTSEELTRDQAEQDRHHNDGLIQDAVSLQCLGDMIYQGNKMLTKRWKNFPGPLPMLLLHGTEDPICSYQATATLSTQLLKLRPTNFVFKSWKGNKHDPHWDIDANSIKSEYVHWIRNTVRHFDKVPLNPNMVHSDCIKSARSRAAFKNDKSDKSQKERTKADKKKKEHEQHIQATVNLTTDASSMEATKAVGVKENPAESHPEQIQGLEDLRRQQQQRLERLEAKRREYVEGDEKVKRKAAGQSTVPEADQHKPAEELKASEAIMPIVPETIQPSAPETIQSNAPEAIQSEATNANEIEAFSMGSPASAAGDQAQVEETEFKAAEGPVDGATANTIAAVAVEIAMQEGEASNEDQAEEPTQDNNANVLDLPEAALENTNHEIEFSSAVEPTPPQATPTAVLSEPTQHGDGKEADQEGHDAGREICNVLPAANEQMTIAAPDEIAAESIIAVEPCEAVAEAAEPIKEALSVPDALPETEVADDGTRSRLEHAE